MFEIRNTAAAERRDLACKLLLLLLLLLQLSLKEIG